MSELTSQIMTDYQLSTGLELCDRSLSEYKDSHSIRPAIHDTDDIAYAYRIAKKPHLTAGLF